jgi:sulfatase maturation enzyme AslB (radical SAM superfamily)
MAVSSVKKCSHCQLVSYCSRACQKSHWIDHKRFCDKIAINNRTYSQSTLVGSFADRFMQPLRYYHTQIRLS